MARHRVGNVGLDALEYGARCKREVRSVGYEAWYVSALKGGHVERLKTKSRQWLMVGDTCQRGHVVTEETLYRYPDGRTACRVCYRLTRAVPSAFDEMPEAAPTQPGEDPIPPSWPHRRAR